MQIIEIKTLLDITDTKVVRATQGSKLEHDQCRNFITMKQCVEIRSIISYDTSPVMGIVDIKDMGFGSKYKGKHAVWTFRFSPDREGPYADGVSEVGCLFDDIDQVPVVKNLTETINIEKPIFDTKNIDYKNIIIKALKGTI
jgi:hypothetical protein